MVRRTGELRDTTYELFVGALSILSIVNLVIEFAAGDDVVRQICFVIDFVLSAVFLLDFLYRLITAESRAGYFVRQYGWADLLASIPLPGFKVLRLFRIVRVSRLMRRYGGRRMARHFTRNAAQGALLSVFFLIILILEFGSIGMWMAERNSPDANIRSASDAIWWAYVSITTVGYGDRYPVTNAGRAWGILVLAGGVGLFGVLTGYLANVFLAPRRREGATATALPGDDPRAWLLAVKEAAADQRAAQEALEDKLAELERRLGAAGDAGDAGGP